MNKRRQVRERLVERHRFADLRPWWLGGLTALLVGTPLIPSETVAVFDGAAVIFVMAAFALCAAYGLGELLAYESTRSSPGDGRLVVRLELGLPALLLAALLVWHSLSGWGMASYGQPRQTWHVVWIWNSFGAVWLLVRRLVVHESERRTLVAVMLGLAVVVSLQGVYQYAIDLPRTRAMFRSDPAAMLAAAGIDAPLGSPQYKQFVDRLESSEPMGPFALANSLAGFLLPWLIVGGGLLLHQWRSLRPGKPSAERRWLTCARLGVLTATVALLALCLVLTKSRTAWLAGLGGVVLLGAAELRPALARRRRYLVGAGALLLALGALAVFGVTVGGVDELVLTEAGKSLRYRLEYWRGAAALIADHPWFGCGPGNFQQYYATYKLPTASETVADPHNFILEIGATAGLPALGILFGLLAAWFAAAIGRSKAAIPPSSAVASSAAQPRAVVWGALAGLLLAFPAGAAVDHVPHAILLLAAPIGGLVVAALAPWIWSGDPSVGRTTKSTLAPPDEADTAASGDSAGWELVAVVVVLVNLLAAGGIGYPGVCLSLWLLLAMGCRARPIWRLRLGRPVAWVLPAAALAVAAAAYCTEFLPTLRAMPLLLAAHDAQRRGETELAETALLKAAQADPASDRPWWEIVAIRHARWIRTGAATDRENYQQAQQQLLTLHPRSEAVPQQLGRLALTSYRRRGDRDELAAAVRWQRAACELYPNHGLGQAQLAWVLFLAGHTDDAQLAAYRALQLDAAHQHREWKLAAQRLYDVAPAFPDQPPGPGDRSAEQWMQWLRKQ